MTKPQKTAVACLSGGLDSTISTLLTHAISPVVEALTFHYGQAAADKEVEFSSRFCEKHGIPHRVFELPWLSSKRSALTSEHPIPELSVADLHDFETVQRSGAAVWVPNRNGVFLQIAAARAEELGAHRVCVGFNREEASTFPDNSRDFLMAVNASLRYSTKNKVQVVCPTLSMDKKEILGAAQRLHVSLDTVWSCYYGGERPCGACESCRRTERGLQQWTVELSY